MDQRQTRVPYSDTSTSDDPLFLSSVARVVQVLAAFETATQPMTLQAIATAARIDKSAAQRIVHTLRKLGVIMRDEEDHGYLLGLRILDMTLDFMRMNPLVKRANPVLLALRRQVMERVDLSFFDDTRLIYASRMPSKHETFHATLPGHSVPTYCTAGGIAVLSRLHDDQIRDIVKRSDLSPYTPFTVISIEQVLEHVQQARVNGFACMQRQLLRDEIALGVCITGASGQPLGAIHVAGSLLEWQPEEFIRKISALLQEAGQTISMG